ncbi:2-C-methyl-D-erythritol 4-phosphate cytidylyltransferase [bacterium]|nr:2-C-methyl-D-erythritol 4-phosphate cytidylyltransferase [bacterium]MBU4134029.1 2-C-methyl-D-erythritol 4-phosphate cytidylyltransferase [bacterium]
MTGTDFRPSCAVLLASGKGSRTGFSRPKQFVKIAGKELYRHSLDVLLNSPLIDEVILVVPRGFAGKIKVKNSKLKITTGGKRRQDSLLKGISRLGKNFNTILAHDSARPFITDAVVKSVLSAAGAYGAAIAAEQITDTVKEVNGGFVKSTLDRTKLFQAATPQAFKTGHLEKIKKLLAGKQVFTDEAAVMEKLGMPVKIISVGRCNMKVTEKEDFTLAENLLEKNAKRLNRRR